MCPKPEATQAVGMSVDEDSPAPLSAATASTTMSLSSLNEEAFELSASPLSPLSQLYDGQVGAEDWEQRLFRLLLSRGGETDEAPRSGSSGSLARVSRLPRRSSDSSRAIAR